MKNLLIGLAALFLVGSIFYKMDNEKKVEESLQAKESSQWLEFSPESKRFKVLLPGKPQYVRDLIDIPDAEGKRHYEVYLAEKKDGAMFMVNLITYPQEFEGADLDKLLDQAIHEMAQAKPENKIEKIEKTSEEKEPSSDFIIKNEKFTIRGKALLNNKTIVVLSYVSNAENFHQADFETFIHSFKFLPKT